MVVQRGLVIAWLIAVVCAQVAAADDAPALLRPSGRSIRPASATAERAEARQDAGAMHDTEVRPAQFVAPQPNPGEPLGFRESHYDPSMASAPTSGDFDPGILADEHSDFYDSYDSMDPDAPAPTISSGDWIRNGFWYTQQSVVMMSRSTTVKNSIRLAFDVSSSVLAAAQNVLTTPLDMGYEPGLRSTFGRYIGRDDRNRDHSVEFTFLGLTHWHDGGSLTAAVPGGVFTDIERTRTIPVFSGSDFQSYDQTSTFNSYEINYRIERRLSRDKMVYTRDSQWVRECTPAALPSIFAGVRAVTIDETFLYQARSNLGPGTYSVNTYNNLVGLQVGTDWFYERSDWRAGVRAKGAGAVNWTSFSSHAETFAFNRNESAKDHPLAFIGELNFIGVYNFRPNLALRASYDLTWVTNVTIAQNQLTFVPSTPPVISDQHALFYQGVTIGLELSH